MDENTSEEEQAELGETTVSKAWLKNTDKSLARLQNVKKTYYRLGGGPKEREVDCQCNYRSKHSSSFVNMDADPPRLSHESQQTASNQNVSVRDLVKTQHKDKTRNSHPKQKRRPYSATICRVADYTSSTTCEEKPSNTQVKSTKAFISVMGQNVNPQVKRPQSGSHVVHSEQLYKGACLLHLDPQHVEQEEKVRLEGLRKYSAYGQDDDDDNYDDDRAVTVPKPPRASPELQSYPPERSQPNVSPVESSSDECFDDADLELQSLSEHSSSLTSLMAKPLVFQIPTAEEDEVSDDDTYAVSERALSADYVEKSQVFLDELAKKQTQEAEELTEMFNKMTHNQDKVDNIDLRSVLSSPSTAREMTTPTSLKEPSDGVNVLNIEMENHPIESVWVEEPYIPRVGNYQQDSHVAFGRFHSPKRRVQSATTTRRRQDDDTFVLRGKTFDILDVKDLAVSRRLSEKSNTEKDTQLVTSAKKDQVRGKPPRPKSSPAKKAQRTKLISNLNSTLKNDSSHEDEERIPRPPLPPYPRRSSLRKSLSQGDVRCLSPEVIASVKKTVSFSNEVLDKHTRLLTSSSPVIKDVPSEILNQEVIEDSWNPLDTKEDTALSTKEKSEEDSIGVVIQNGQEVNEPLTLLQKSLHDDNTKPHNKPKSSVNMIAQVKQAIRCSCHVEQCHCRDITRPTMAVISQAKELMNTSPKNKLLKQRLSRPSSAPIKRDVQSSTSFKPSRSRLATTQHKLPGSEERRPRPVSAHIRRPSNKESLRQYSALRALRGNGPPSPPDTKTSKTKASKKDQTDLGFVWGSGGDDVAASEECEEVYAKFKEKGINITMDTVKRGLMAPARRASENCMASFGMSTTSSGLLSRPETWLPEEYKRIKIWDDVLKKR